MSKEKQLKQAWREGRDLQRGTANTTGDLSRFDKDEFLAYRCGWDGDTWPQTEGLLKRLGRWLTGG